jgi:hypothetical protein
MDRKRNARTEVFFGMDNGVHMTLSNIQAIADDANKCPNTGLYPRSDVEFLLLETPGFFDGCVAHGTIGDTPVSYSS